MLPDIKVIIAYAALAPSGHNSQPWKFATEGHFIKLRPDYSRSLSVVDADHHELFISMGCALENLIIAAKELGYNSNIMYDLVDLAEEILVHIYKEDAVQKDYLFESITERHVNRGPYQNTGVPKEVLEQLYSLSATEDIGVFMITNNEVKHKIALLLKKAAYIQFNRKEYRKELLSWIRFNEKSATENKDGLRIASMGGPSVHPKVGSFIFEHFVTPNKEAIKAEHLADESPTLVVFATKDRSKRHWIQLGRSFERFSLAATRYNIAHAHLNMACEEESVRKELKSLLGIDNEPLLLIRIGYSDKTSPPSYRRSIDTMITEAF